MPFLYISPLKRLMAFRHEVAFQPPALEDSTMIQVDFTAGVTVSADIPDGTKGIRLVADTACHFKIGVNEPVAAVATDPYLPANVIEYQNCWSQAVGNQLGPCTAVAATNVITIPGLSGLAVHDRITFLPPVTGTLPGGITVGTVYFVITVAADDITISLTRGGAALDITSDGSAIAHRGAIRRISVIAH